MEQYVDEEASSWLRKAQLADIKRVYGTTSSSLDDIKTLVIDIHERALAEPEASMHWLELLLIMLAKHNPFGRKEHSMKDHSINSEELLRVFLTILFSLGGILRDILPSYVIVDDGAPDDRKMQSKRRLFDAHALSVYKRWLHRHLFTLINSLNKLKGHGEDEIMQIKKALSIFVGDFIAVARLTNFSEEYATTMVKLIRSITSESELELFTPVIEGLKQAVQADVSLKMAAGIVTVIKESVFRRRTSDKPPLPAVTLTLLKLFAAMDVDKKERNAELELSRRNLRPGVDLSKSRDALERACDEQIMKDVAPSLIYGDFKAFKRNKAYILTELVTILVRVLRDPHNQPVEVLFFTFQEFSKLTSHVNIELMHEIINELKNLCHSTLQNHNVIRSGVVILGAVMACLQMLDSGRTEEVETDRSWIGQILISAIEQSLPFFTVGNDNNLSSGLNPNLLKDIVASALKDRRTFGILFAELAQMAQCPRAVELFVSMHSLNVHIEDSDLFRALEDINKTLLKRFPSLNETFDPDGIILSSLEPPKTIAWADHLMKMSLNARIEVRELST